MGTLTTLGLVAMLSMAGASRAMCFVHNGADLKRTRQSSLRLDWSPLSLYASLNSLPSNQNQVLADNKDYKTKTEPNQNVQNADGGRSISQNDKGRNDPGSGRDGGEDHGGGPEHDHDHGHRHHRYPHSGCE